MCSHCKIAIIIIYQDNTGARQIVVTKELFQLDCIYLDCIQFKLYQLVNNNLRAFEGLKGIGGGGAKLPIVENGGGAINCGNCFVTLFVVDPVTTRSTPIKNRHNIVYVSYILLNHSI